MHVFSWLEGMEPEQSKRRCVYAWTLRKHQVCALFSQNFYKTELNKEEMYIRYIHKLYDLHLKAQNFTGKNAWDSGGGSELDTDAFAMVTPPPYTVRDEDARASLPNSNCILIMRVLLNAVFSILSLHGFSESALGIMEYIANSTVHLRLQFAVLI